MPIRLLVGSAYQNVVSFSNVSSLLSSKMVMPQNSRERASSSVSPETPMLLVAMMLAGVSLIISTEGDIYVFFIFRSVLQWYV